MVLAALQPALPAPTPPLWLAWASLPLSGPGLLLAQSPSEGQRDLSREEGMALYHWARGYLLEIGAEREEGGHDLATDLERLRAMYFMSVEDRDWVGRAADLLHRLEGRVILGSREGVTLQAYTGAMEVVRAKHARWPPNKLSHLREGIGLLDRIVEEEPENLEARYLRLVSCYYLPFFLKREESVREDFQVLVEGLPHHPESFSPAVYEGVVRFVLDNGELSEGERILLQEALRALPGQRL